MAKIIKKNRGSDSIMTKEQEAIEILEGMVKSYIEADKCGLSNNDFKHEIRAMQTVLNMIKEKDKEIKIQKHKKTYARQNIIFKNKQLGQLRKNNKRLKKIIDLMAEQLAGLTIWDIEKDEPVIPGNKEDVIKFFERKAEEC